jgi:hypothetical protein
MGLAIGAEAGAGAAIGALIKHDVWAPMETTKLRLRVAPSRRGAGVNVTLHF